MKTVYILWNYDEDVALLASEDEGLLEEVLCDTYFEDAYYDFCWAVASPWSRSISVEDLPEYAHMAHKNTTEWYEDYMCILEIPVIN